MFNELDVLISRSFSLSGRLPALEVLAENKKLPSDLHNSNPLLINDSAEMPDRKPRHLGGIGNLQECFLNQSIAWLHGPFLLRKGPRARAVPLVTPRP